MLIVFAKLADIAVRSMFVLLVLYSLPVRASGQFGLTLTLIGFLSFVAGFERYADLQRHMAASGAVEQDRLIVSTLRFYAVNYAVCLPLLFLLLTAWAQLSAAMALLCLVIAIGEHISNEVYRLSLIAPRHRTALFATLARNAALLAFVVAELWREGTLDLARVLVLWAITAMFGVIAAGVVFSRTWAFSSTDPFCGAGLLQRQQYAASRTHFVIGLVALVALQADRVVVGGLLTLDETGVYFRNVFLASFAYQVFNIASYNRLAPAVYASAASGNPGQAKRAVRREAVWVVAPSLVVVGGLPFVDLSPWVGTVHALESVRPALLAALVFAFLVRVLADYNALILNALYLERQIFRAQTAAVALVVPTNVLLTRFFGLSGTAAALILSSILYLVFSATFLARSESAGSRTP